MRAIRISLVAGFAAGAVSAVPRSSFGQGPASYSPPRDAGQATIIEVEDHRSGPRIGAAYLIGGSVTAEQQGVHVQPMMSLFGWQSEHPFPTGIKDAPVPVVELIGLVGGLEQSRFLASGSLILGARQPNGWEAGIGPTVTGAGTQLTAAIGYTHKVGYLNFPINLAVSPGRRGASLSLTTGFNRHTP